MDNRQHEAGNTGARLSDLTPEWERRLRWHCRRGMLEVDLLLQRFLDRHLASLTPEERAALEDLLTYDDVELTAMLHHRRECPDARFATLIAHITEL